MRMQQRRRTATTWTSGNDVLLDGELGVEIDTKKIKIGDGTTGWNSLGYSSGGDYVALPKARTALAGKPNGTLTVYDTGQTVWNSGSSPLTVSSGALTHTVGGAGYLGTSLGQRVGRIGATFTVSSAADPAESVTLIMSAQSWQNNSTGFPPAACHFSISATGWTYGIWTGSGQDVLAQGGLALAPGTTYEIDIFFDGPTARVILPTGQVVAITDARIDSYAGNEAVHELFSPDGTYHPAAILAMRLDTTSPAPLDGRTASRALSGLARIADTAWTTPTPGSGWSNYGAGFAPLGYRKDASGFVHVRGMLAVPGTTTGTVFTLPVGYRPEFHEWFPAVSNDLLAEARISLDGTVTIAGNASSGSWLSIAGISFYAAT